MDLPSNKFQLDCDITCQINTGLNDDVRCAGRDVLTGTTTSEATHAQGEETVEDAENTEHDISAAAESLEPTSESQVQEVADDEAGLEDIMEHLLDRYAFHYFLFWSFKFCGI
jgi:hypothetical protein